jgi:hypothetical protein
MEYHKNKKYPGVMRILGHRNINTSIYTQLVNFKDDDYTRQSDPLATGSVPTDRSRL